MTIISAICQVETKVAGNFASKRESWQRRNGLRHGKLSRGERFPHFLTKNRSNRLISRHRGMRKEMLVGEGSEEKRTPGQTSHGYSCKACPGHCCYRWLASERLTAFDASCVLKQGAFRAGDDDNRMCRDRSGRDTARWGVDCQYHGWRGRHGDTPYRFLRFVWMSVLRCV